MTFTALELPTGYYLEWDPDILLLRGPDGATIAAFAADGAADETIRRTAEEAAYGEPPDTHLRVSFFGNFEIFVDGEVLPLGANAKAVAILKYLLAHRARTVSRDYLMGWLWPESNAKKARWSLNSAVHALRKISDEWTLLRAPCANFVVFEGGRYRLCPSLRVSTDVDEFDAHYECGRRLMGEGRRHEAATEYEEAVRLYRGDYLVEELYEDWTMVERERLINAYVSALTRLADYYAETARYEEGVRACYRILEKEPCQEGAYRILMECYAGLGLPTLAGRQYRLCQETLRRKRGVSPSSETETLYRRISGD
jgi:DNA-binding SARP family transcriptional activator